MGRTDCFDGRPVDMHEPPRAVCIRRGVAHRDTMCSCCRGSLARGDQGVFAYSKEPRSFDPSVTLHVLVCLPCARLFGSEGK